jgi:hypothetical protein
MTKKSIISIFVAGFIALAALAVPVGAVSENARTYNVDENRSTQQQADRTDNPGTGRLEEAMLRACQAREARIKNMLSNTNQLGQGQLNLFDNVTHRVKAYYENNSLTAENYDELVSQIEQYRFAARSSLIDAVSISDQFGCDTEDPKGTANQFRSMVQTQIQALKDYRTSIKNLISAVRDAAIETSEE